MKRRTLFIVSVTWILCFAAAAWAPAEENAGNKYYVGEVVGLDAVNNTMTITEYNTNSQQQFGFGRTGLPQDIFLGDEVVVGADKNREAKEIRLLSGNNRAMPVGPARSAVSSGSGRGPSGGSFGEWDPFYDIARMQEQMSRMFQDSLQGGDIDQGLLNSNLSFDKDFKLEDTGKEYILKLDMTGLDKDSVKIEIDKNSITLKGQNEIDKKEDRRNGSFQYHSFGSFVKTIPLPPDADTRSLDSKLEGDIMIIKMPKKNK